jgi:hypothetical protein
MSASTLTTVFCDGCGTWVDEAGVGDSAREVRSRLRARGWAVNLPPTEDFPRMRRDLCPTCRY